MGFIIENIGTVAVVVIIIALCTVAVCKIVRDRKKGKSCCSGNCEGCSSCGMCHKGKNNS